MRSRAHIKTHPLHPILIPFPIAFFAGAVVFDLLGILADNTEYTRTAWFLLIAGVASALVAAVPGLIDLLGTVPPASSARQRGIRHALLNVCMLALFSAALIYRSTGGELPAVWLGLEGLGLAVMLVAGWLGGTLVHRNQIGVDPRYAFAGKWRELRIEPDTHGAVALGDLRDLRRDQMMLVHPAGKRIVVARSEEGLVAFDDRCTHKGGSLAGGMMICGTVQCPWHGSQFSVHNGEIKAGPAEEKISTYQIRGADNNFYLSLK